MRTGKETVTIELVTPETAKAYLQTSKGNRSLRKGRLQVYGNDAIRGKWLLTHQGIAFDEDGCLVDGHHRMHMVIATGMPQRFVVFRGMCKEAVVNIDGGLPRSAKDAFSMALKGDYSDALIATAAAFELLPASAKSGRNNRSNADVLETIEVFSEALIFACEHMRGVVCNTRGSRILIARAFYHADIERLKEFCQVMKTHKPISANPEHDDGAFVFERFLSRGRGHGTSTLEEERYCKGQTCLKAFLNYQPMQKVYGTSDDLFPVPEVETIFE